MIAIEEVEHKGYTIKIYPDPDPESPREWSNVTRMVLLHRRYNLSDKDLPHPLTVGGFEEYWKEHGEGGIRQKVYGYDHSGLCISTTPFSCPWDSGLLGYCYVLKDDIDQECAGDHALARKHIEQEVEVYNKYIMGGFVGYDITGPDGEDIGSCWGYDDSDCALEEAKSAVDYWVAERAKNERETAACMAV